MAVGAQEGLETQRSTRQSGVRLPYRARPISHKSPSIRPNGTDDRSIPRKSTPPRLSTMSPQINPKNDPKDDVQNHQEPSNTLFRPLSPLVSSQCSLSSKESSQERESTSPYHSLSPTVAIYLQLETDGQCSDLPDSRRGSLKRKFDDQHEDKNEDRDESEEDEEDEEDEVEDDDEDDDEDEGTHDKGKSIQLPGLRTLLSSISSGESGYSRGAATLRTPSPSPEPNSNYVFSRRSSSFLADDPIMEKLNYLRRQDEYKHPLPFRQNHDKERRDPLPLLEGLCEPRPAVLTEYTGVKPPSTRVYDHAEPRPRLPYDYIHRPCLQSPSPPRETARKQRSKTSDEPHCNLKYFIEETDYIRYQRVDLGQSWDTVHQLFNNRYPMKDINKNRKPQGLQGANYRDNKCLPKLSGTTSRLVFMENGHVEKVWIKTRQQKENAHLYTLVYLFPERAINYPWILPKDRRRALELHEDRQRQKAGARDAALKRGTYVEPGRLQPEDCACCPKQDRKNDIVKRAVPLGKRQKLFMAKL
ncbi:hypothetical protein GGR57DRAFT_135113 [Xylariaceae sp. FL1272]|nr:hypothetical protein GGR57DRAFT_135113 [Xylariaceae sp. FL1272]